MQPPPPPDALDPQLQYLHCNKCGCSSHSVDTSDQQEQLGRHPSPQKDLFVSQCSHVLCIDCLESPLPSDFDGKSSLAHKCPLCSATSALVKLDSDMQPDVKKIIAPFIETLENALEVAKFQYGNATSLIRFLKHSADAKLENLQSIVDKYNENNRVQNAKIQQLVSEMDTLKTENTHLKQQLKSQKRASSNAPQPRQPSVINQVQHFPAPNPMFQPPPQQQRHQEIQEPRRATIERFREQTPTNHNRSSAAMNPNSSPLYQQRQPPQQQQQHHQQISPIQTPAAPNRLSLPRPASAMSGTSTSSIHSTSPNRSSSSNFTNSHLLQQQNNQLNNQRYRPSGGSSHSSGLSAAGRDIDVAYSPQNQFIAKPQQQQQQPHSRLSRRPETASAAFPNSSDFPPRSTAANKTEMMIIDADLDDAAALQRGRQQHQMHQIQKQQQHHLQQQQRSGQSQRPMSMAGGTGVSSNHNPRMGSNAETERIRSGSVVPNDGKTVLNRNSFNSGSIEGRYGGQSRVGTPQVSSMRI